MNPVGLWTQGERERERERQREEIEEKQLRRVNARPLYLFFCCCCCCCCFVRLLGVTHLSSAACFASGHSSLFLDLSIAFQPIISPSLRPSYRVQSSGMPTSMSYAATWKRSTWPATASKGRETTSEKIRV